MLKLKRENLAFYPTHLEKITSHFDELQFTYLIREENHFINAVEKLASMIAIPNKECKMTVNVDKMGKPADFLEIKEESEEVFSMTYYISSQKGNTPLI